MNTFSIRTPLPEDASDLASLTQQLGYKATAAIMQERIAALQQSDADQVFCAVKENKVVGWLHIFYTQRLETGIFCEIGGLVIEEANRSQGIGSALVQEAVKWAKAKRAPTLKVRSNLIRTRTHGFYLNNGFREIKNQKVFDLQL